MYTSKRNLVGLLVMVLLTLAGVMRQEVGNLAIGVGLVLFLFGGSRQALDLRALPHWLRRRETVWMALAPAVLGILSLLLASAVLPEYLSSVYNPSIVLLVLPTLLGQAVLRVIVEEIAWRGFFQHTLLGWMRGPVLPAIVLTAAVCTLGQFSAGSAAVVAYRLLLVFVNSVVYGLLFYRTQSVLLCAGSHLLAELLPALLLALL